MKGWAELIFETRYPQKIYQALTPEVEDDLHRSKVRMDLVGDSIKLRIDGDDIVSLRAALNTWIRLIKIAFEMVEI